MKRGSARTMLAFVLLMATASSRSQAIGEGRPELFLREMQAVVHSEFGGDKLPPRTEFAELTATLFNKILGPPNGLSDAEIEKPGFFEAVDAANLYIQNSGLDARVQREFLELEGRAFARLPKRKVVDDAGLGNYYGKLILARDVGTAEKIFQTHSVRFSEEGAPPIGVDGLGVRRHVVWRLDTPPKVMEVHAAISDPPERLVIVVQPSCVFAREAMAHIESRGLQLPVLVLASPGTSMEWDAWQQWNATYPRHEMMYIRRVEDWALLPETRVSPAFYLLRDGQIVASSLGWISAAAFDVWLASVAGRRVSITKVH